MGSPLGAVAFGLLERLDATFEVRDDTCVTALACPRLAREFDDLAESHLEPVA